MTAAPKDKLIAFYDQYAEDAHHRYKSWEHCYSHFQKLRRSASAQNRQVLSLHLSSYLASWGMYRGSSFLLQRDYTIHDDAVAVLLEPRFDRLWDVSFEDPAQDEAILALLETLRAALRQCYWRHIDDQGLHASNPSDTLVTKILLGTMGCAPAADRFLRAGLKQQGLSYRNFARFMKQMIDFWRNHAAAFAAARAHISARSPVHHPPMKLVDMYLWEIGAALDADKKAQP